eukprot:1619480-Prymnesium_polylepis.1
MRLFRKSKGRQNHYPVADLSGPDAAADGASDGLLVLQQAPAAAPAPASAARPGMPLPVPSFTLEASALVAEFNEDLHTARLGMAFADVEER